MTRKLRRRFTKEQKESALKQLEAGASVTKVAAGLCVSPNAVLRWRQEARRYGTRAFLGYGNWRAVVQRKTHQVIFNLTHDEYDLLVNATRRGKARSVSSFARTQVLTNGTAPLLVQTDRVLDKLAAALTAIDVDSR